MDIRPEDTVVELDAINLKFSSKKNIHRVQSELY